MYSLFSVSCFLTFFISGLTSFVFEILKLSTFDSAAVSEIFSFFFVLVFLGEIFLTIFLVFFEIIFLVFLAFAVFLASMSSCWICLVVLSSWLSYDFLHFLFALVLSFRMCLFVLHLLHELWFPCTFILHQPVLSSGRRLPRTFSYTLVVRQVDIFISSSHVSYALWVVRQLFHSFVHECCDTWYD